VVELPKMQEAVSFIPSIPLPNNNKIQASLSYTILSAPSQCYSILIFFSLDNGNIEILLI
jgi:hypothetical protein